MTTSAPTISRGEAPLQHDALLYRDPGHLRAVTGEFARAGAAAEEPLLAVLPSPTLAVVSDVLESSGVVLEVLDAGEAGRNPNRLIPTVLQWLADRPDRSRILSESIWPGRDEVEMAECLRHEALVNHALGSEPVSLLCPFDAAHLDGEILAGAEMTHPRVIDETGLRPSVLFGDPLVLARGENWPQREPVAPVCELSFDGDLWALRRRLEQVELLAELPPQRREDLVLAVNEAASNAVRHGDGTCRARIWRDGGRIVCEISTTTSIDDPLAGRRRPDPDAISGRGLWLINQLCDLVELRNGPAGANVRMHVALA
jgi:anti-sigma regulatory factor (Ser/Thr protein kinase)